MTSVVRIWGWKTNGEDNCKRQTFELSLFFGMDDPGGPELAKQEQSMQFPRTTLLNVTFNPHKLYSLKTLYSEDHCIRYTDKASFSACGRLSRKD